MADKETLSVYAARAEDYASRFCNASPGRHLAAFMAELPAQARVLDLGCGPGGATAAMRDAGFRVDAWDASPEMAEVGRQKFGLDIRVSTFGDLDARDTYDGIYANFSLLHAPKADMPAHLTRIARALKPSGLLHLGLKTGTSESRDALGRFYAYYAEDEIAGLLEDADFQITSRATGEEAGLEGTVQPWIILRATTHV